MSDLYEQFLLQLQEAGTVQHSEHDTEMERHMGMLKSHSFHIPAKKEFVHMYLKGQDKPKPSKPGEKKIKPNKTGVLKSMMKYHGYEPIKNNSKTRLSFRRDLKNKYHEIHADIDADGEPKAVYHRERFK